MRRRDPEAYYRCCRDHNLPCTRAATAAARLGATRPGVPTALTVTAPPPSVFAIEGGANRVTHRRRTVRRSARARRRQSGSNVYHQPRQRAVPRQRARGARAQRRHALSCVNRTVDLAVAWRSPISSVGTDNGNCFPSFFFFLSFFLDFPSSGAAAGGAVRAW